MVPVPLITAILVCLSTSLGRPRAAHKHPHQKKFSFYRLLRRPRLFPHASPPFCPILTSFKCGLCQQIAAPCPPFLLSPQLATPPCFSFFFFFPPDFDPLPKRPVPPKLLSHHAFRWLFQLFSLRPIFLYCIGSSLTPEIFFRFPHLLSGNFFYQSSPP